MSYMVLLVIDDVEHGPAVLDAWEEAGVKGVTIMRSSGLGRIRQAGLRDDLPLMPGLDDLLESEEHPNNTFISVVDSQELVDKMVAIAQDILGDMNGSNTGFLCVLPVNQVYGLGKPRPDKLKG